MSVRQRAQHLAVPCVVTSELYDVGLPAFLESHDHELIVSFSAPIVFKERLLSLPRHGCMNLPSSRRQFRRQGGGLS
jgi:methionyl-tRNA formyltransferase